MPRQLETIDGERLRSLLPLVPLFADQALARRAYLVGGGVRDLLLGIEPTDLDVVVEGEFDGHLAGLAAQVVRHQRFGTATVSSPGGTLDLAQARTETYPEPGSLPEVAPASVPQDLARRDFTINSIAVPLREPQILLAPEHALEDLAAGRLRVLHDASFHDDATRLWRLVRYAARLGFEIEPHTRRLAEAAILREMVWSVGGHRLGQELRRLVREPGGPAALEIARSLGLDRALRPGFGLRDAALAERALRLLPDEGARGELLMAIAALPLGAADTRTLLDRLGFSAPERDRIVRTVATAAPMAEALASATQSSQIARAVAGEPLEAVALAGALGAERPARQWLEGLRHVRLEIRGEDLLDAGVAPGPGIGAGLRAALEAKLEGDAADRDAELAVALKAATAPPLA